MAIALIASEDNAWALLRDLLNLDSEADAAELPEFEFYNWPILDVTSKKGESEIDALTMKGFVKYQEAVWRSYLTLSQGTRNLQHIEHDEKRQLLFSVKVGRGSSDYDIDFTEVFAKIGTKLAGKLSSRDIMILVIVLALTFAGQSVWKTHIAENAKVRIDKVHSEEMKQLLDTFTALSGEETERLKVLSEVFKEVPEARVSEAEAGPARQELLRSLPEGFSVTIEGIELPADVLREIVKSERKMSEDVVVTRAYFIDRAQTNADGFQVRLRDCETDETVSAHFGEALSSVRERALVEQAFFHKEPIVLTLDARQRGDLIVSATITNAELIKP
ncbi:MAG: hypothetical protein RH945_03220 [Hyphomonas sp.]